MRASEPKPIPLYSRAKSLLIPLPPTYSRKSISGLLQFFCWCAIILTLVQHIATLNVPFTYDAGTISADVSTMARSFARHGIFTLRGVPVNNNDPLGISRAAYTHWPPLLPMLLSVLFNSFGESEAIGHGLMAVILLLTTSFLYLIAQQVLPPKGAYFTILFYLTLPVVVQFSILISQQALAILFMLFALFSFLRATSGPALNRFWSGMACAAMCFAVWSSWEPFWLPFCLIAVAAWRRNRTELQLAKLLCAVCLMAVSTVILLYVLGAPEEMLDTVQALKYRVGLSRTYSSLLLQRHTPDNQIGIGQIVRNLSLFYPEMLGVAGITAVAWLLATAVDRFSWRPAGSQCGVTVFAGVIGPWFIWYGLMWNHVAKHSFEMLVAAPATALAMAYCANRIVDLLNRHFDERQVFRITLILVIVPLLCLAPLVSATGRQLVVDRSRTYLRVFPSVRLNPDPRAPDSNMRLADVVHSRTPENAVVLTSLVSGVPVYYSNRHMIRLIQNDASLTRIFPLAEKAFPSVPLFLAVPPQSVSLFPESIRRSSRIAQTPDVVVYRLSKGS